MSAKPNKAADFLKAMQQGEPAEQIATTPAPGTPTAMRSVPATQAAPKVRRARSTTPTRIGKKHFGGYLGDDTLEKIALLRVRLKKDNSELIEFAIEELFRKHNAKRAFGDA